MKIHRCVVGIRFNEKMFRLASVRGHILDKVLSLRGSAKKIDEDYFTKIARSEEIDDPNVSFINEDKTNVLILTSEQIILKKKIKEGQDSISINKTLEDFEIFWKEIDSIIGFSEVRRIGFVAEHRLGIEEKNNEKLCKIFKSVSRFTTSDAIGKFKIYYEDRKLSGSLKDFDSAVSDYVNIIKSVYTSNQHNEDPEENHVNYDIDVQKYFNPACKNPLKEFSYMKRLFGTERDAFLRVLKEMEAIENE